MTLEVEQTFGTDVRAVVEPIGVHAWVHARPIDTTGTQPGSSVDVGVGADEPVVAASVFKIAVLVEFCRRVASGEIDPQSRRVVAGTDRVLGPTGLSIFSDDAEMSLRDLAVSMMYVSDNTATDVMLDLVGIDNVNDTLEHLGLGGTRLVGDCGDLLGSLLEDLGLDSTNYGRISDLDAEQVRRSRVLNPATTNCSTPRETTALLSAIWADQAGPPAACEEARRVLSLQIWPHRLVSGLPAGVQYAGKTGTLPGIRNEAGVISFGDGQAYAVAVFTRAEDLEQHRPEVDRAIGQIGRLALDRLRPS